MPQTRPIGSRLRRSEDVGIKNIIPGGRPMRLNHKPEKTVGSLDGRLVFSRSGSPKP
jgi:hypothetical protein